MLVCKVYVSSARAVQDAASLAGILQEARRNNAANGVSGVLCVFDSNFIQVLEGEAEQVEQTFAKIRNDPRHRNIIELLDEPIGERLYPDWTMALTTEERLDPSQRAACRDLRRDALDPSATAAHRDAVSALLEAFKFSLR